MEEPWLPLPLAAAVLLSFLFCGGVLTLRSSPSGALHAYTDHQRHAAYAYAALERGPAVYLAPTRELVEQSAFRHPVREWPETRYLYPPGPLVLFLPLALLGQETPISTGAFHRACGVFVALLAHVGLWFGLGRMLLLPRGWKVLAAVMLWAYCLRCALCGQYEPLWLAPAALLLTALDRRRFDHALGWLALAWMTHDRAVVLLPFGVLAGLRLLRSGDAGRWRWLLLVGAAGAIGGVCFVLGVQAPIRAELPLHATPGDGRMVVAVVGTLGGIALGVLAGDAVLGAVVALIGLTGIADVGHWWHASAIFVPLMSRDAAAQWKRPIAATVGFLVWVSAMRFVWLDRPLGLVKDLRDLAARSIWESGPQGTFAVAVPATVPLVAAMVTFPLSRAVARPWESAALEITTTVGSSDVQVTWVVRSTCEESLKVPSAVNCWVKVLGMVTSDGLTAIESRMASVTRRVVEPEMVPTAARTVVVPTESPVARPGEPALAIDATTGSVDDQVTVEVNTCVLPSLKVPVAMNCCVNPRGMEGAAGVTASDTRVAGVTVRSVEPVFPPKSAEMVVVPTPAALAFPLLPAALEMVATAVFEEAQVAVWVRSKVLPSE
jgi:hypothetical protein